ncbi:MAG: DUF3592 domain-containing protein [Cyanobacteria bacterium]|nr:DUF3592 domain-containing protein [Cyanobacteriota bacterium]
MNGLKLSLPLLFSLPFLGIGVLLLLLGSREVISAWESVHWPTAQGQITASSIRERHRRSRRSTLGTATHSAQVRYQFVVDRQRFEGDRIAYGDHGSSDRRHAEGIISRYPQGKTVTVHYRPGQPTDALLEPGIQLQTWFLPGFGLIFTGAGLWVVVRAMAKPT